MELAQTIGNYLPRNNTKTATWLVFLPILLLAIVMRVGLITQVGYKGDTEHFAVWVSQIHGEGLFNFYNDGWHRQQWDRTYPPLSAMMFGFIALNTPNRFYPLGPDFTFLLKLFPVLSELIMVGATFYWLRKDKLLRILVPGLIAIYPGLIATTAWWGQFEAPYVLFVVLSLIAMNRDRPIIAWLCFATAVLIKQPAAAYAPLILILTFRRYGWRPVVIGAGACLLFAGILMLPFMEVSGFKAALTPYLNASDAFPYMANNAYNFWYTVASIKKGEPMNFNEYQFRDHQIMFGSIMYKTAGFAMLGLFELLMSIIIWRQAKMRREFLWGAALFLGFFLLPTQVHERYLFPAAVLTLIAVVQDKRMWWVAATIMITYTYNIMAVAVPLKWSDATLHPEIFAIPVALINIAMLIRIMIYIYRPLPVEAPTEDEIALPAPLYKLLVKA